MRAHRNLGFASFVPDGPGEENGPQSEYLEHIRAARIMSIRATRAMLYAYRSCLANAGFRAP